MGVSKRYLKEEKRVMGLMTPGSFWVDDCKCPKYGYTVLGLGEFVGGIKALGTDGAIEEKDCFKLYMKYTKILPLE